MNYTYLTIIFSVLFFNIPPVSFQALASEKLDQKVLYVANCRIFDWQFNLVKIISSDWLCLPLIDGGWISSNNEQHLARWDAEGGLIWKKKGYFHHQITRMNEDYALVLLSEANIVKKQKIIFDRVQKIRIADGKVANEFSIFEGLYKNKILAKTALDRSPGINPSLFPFFNTALEKSHLNSVMYRDGLVVVNELQMTAFVLDDSLKFVRNVQFPDSLIKSDLKETHDLQSLGNDSFIFFKNFNMSPSSKMSTFKIFEFKGNSITFEFPKKESDFVTSDFSGGVEKLKNSYLVGFPLNSSETSSSLVGIVSNDGRWLTKKTIPFRIQDIKKIPFDNYLKLNKIN